MHVSSRGIGKVIESHTYPVDFKYVLLESHIIACCTLLPPVVTVTVAGALARVSFNNDVAAERAYNRSNNSSTTSSSRKYQSRVSATY